MNTKVMKATVLHAEAAYTGFFELRRLTLEHERFAGGMTNPLVREVLHRSDVAAALLYDTALDKVVMVEQYRAGAHVAGVNPWLIDIVAGRIESGQTPLEAVRREIIEESGLAPVSLDLIGVYLTAPHLSSEKVHLYCATVNSLLASGSHGVAHEDEDIRPLVLSRAEALCLPQIESLSLWAGLAISWLRDKSGGLQVDRTGVGDGTQT
ncbi:MAG: NUDIX domain-containing protein [Azonexus sp.]